MVNKIKRIFKEAEVWLKLAKEAKNMGTTPSYSISVACCSHALIRGVDSLTLKYLGKTAKRHDQALILFKSLITEKHISPGASRLRNDLIKWIKKEKPKAEYTTKYYSKNDSGSAVRSTEKFLRMVKKELKF